ncbi:hypothetical protein [Mycolicibacterium psychrotolerans]|uniref:Uncharacterized protein n=1 Tax=Mycolicibacterium psychrotolerans TaxID=216929 RepID=A0A7I7MBP1_9MYCO|nr:hypothetical protein [Mycolicibacterium psychrotolerans]BBX69711.1 hypothetical protein MPSYJ_31720 [Mycolicibacterium psychrotolerans]
MQISDFDGKRAAVASVQRQLDEQLDAIRRNRSLSDAGRKAELAKVVLAARARVDKMRSDFAAERKARSHNLHKIVFGDLTDVQASAVIAHRDAQDRAAQLETADDARAMLQRANQRGDESLAGAVAETAFRRGWIEVARDYAREAGKSGALDLLIDTAAGRLTNLAESAVFRVQNPGELSGATEPVLQKAAEVHAPGMGPTNW